MKDLPKSGIPFAGGEWRDPRYTTVPANPAPAEPAATSADVLLIRMRCSQHTPPELAALVGECWVAAIAENGEVCASAAGMKPRKALAALRNKLIRRAKYAPSTPESARALARVGILERYRIHGPARPAAEVPRG